MGKTLGVLLLVVALLMGCSNTPDNHNISIVFYKDGQKNVAQISPDDQLIEEEKVNSKTVYKDKLGRWEQIKPDNVVIDYENGEMIVEDGTSGKLVWVYKNQFGRTVKVDFCKYQQDLSKYSSIHKKPISDQAFQLVDYSQDEKEYSHPERFKCKLKNGLIPAVPQRIKEQYFTKDPFFIDFKTLDEGWAKYTSLTKSNPLAYGHQFVSTFFSKKYVLDFAYKVSTDYKGLYRYDNYNPEHNSYWVEKKVGSYKPFYYQGKPCKEIPFLRSSHFKDDVKTFVENTLKPVWVEYKNGDEVVLSSRSIVESYRIGMIPMSRKIWMILVATQNGNKDPDIGKVWTFAVVEFDSDRPLIRAFGQPMKTDAYTWSSIGLTKLDEKWADPDYGIKLYGAADVNLDGCKDFVFGYEGMGSGTVSSYRVMVVSLTGDGFCEIVPDFWFKDFFGLDNGKPLFQLGGCGEGQLYETLTNEGQVSWRWKTRLMMVTEPRKDGFLYLVSYKYHNSIEDILNTICQKTMHYLDFGNCDLIGQTRSAQLAFLETLEYATEEQKEIVRVLILKQKPMLVSSSEELLPELKNHDPFKNH